MFVGRLRLRSKSSRLSTSSSGSSGLDLLSSARTAKRDFRIVSPLPGGLGVDVDIDGLPLFFALSSSTFLMEVGVKNPPAIDPCFFTWEGGRRLTVVGGVANPFRSAVRGRCVFLVEEEEEGAVWIHLDGSGKNRGFYLLALVSPGICVGIEGMDVPCLSSLP